MTFTGVVLTALTTGVGVAVAFWKLVVKAWLEKHLQTAQAAHAKELEGVRSALEHATRRLQSELDKRNYIHQVQFETEFRALRDIWQEAVEAHLNMQNIRPTFEIGTGNLTEDERQQRLLDRLNVAGEAYNRFLKSMTMAEPFYPPDIYDALEQIRQTIGLEFVQVQLQSSTKHVEYWKDAHANREKIKTQMDHACLLIRKRLDLLTDQTDVS